MPLVQRLDPLLAPFFASVSFPEEKVAALREISRQGPLVYVMRSAGALNYAYFAHAYAQRGLPVPTLVHGLGDDLMSRLTGVRRGKPVELAELVERGESALIFLRRPEIFSARRGQPQTEDPFPALVALCRQRDRQVFLVPQVVVWERHPGKLRPGLGSFMVGSPESPSGWRTAGAFFFNFRHAFAKIGTPIDLLDFCREQAQVSEATIARKVRGALWQHLAHEARVVTGPRLKGTDRMVEEVLRDRTLRHTLTQVARRASEAGKGKPARSPAEALQAVTAEARKDLKEIAAAYSPTAIEVIKPTLDLVVNRIYNGIELDEAGLERIRQAVSQGAVILCPSHKSHIDYLILSKILYDAGMTPPHVAAGVNLSFFPLGQVLKSAGAFFLRRSFKGDRVYSAVFRAYIKRLMRDRFTQEFFIEGGRSRTGKLLTPKLGLLTMEVDAWLEGASPDVRFIPIAIDYERIVEGNAYAEEAAGGQKRQEDLGGLLRTPKVLTSRYGRIYLQVDEPLSLKAFCAERGLDPKAYNEQQKRELVQVLAHRIVYGIARSATITPAALVGAAVLAHRRRGLSRSEVADRIGFLRKLGERTGARLSRVLDGAPSDPGVAGPIREATLLLEKDGALAELPASGEMYLVAEPQKRLQLSLYKNNLIHPLVPAALFSAGLLSFREGAPAVGALRERVLWLSRLFKHEFVYRVGSGFTEIFDETLTLCQELGLVVIEPAPARAAAEPDAAGEAGAGPPEGLVRLASIAGRDRIELLRDLVRDFVESYLLATEALEALVTGDLDGRELTKQALARGQAAYLAGRINGLESLSKPNLENAWIALREAGLLAGARKFSLPAAVKEDPERLRTFRDEIARYL